jgi:hypothetical protein
VAIADRRAIKASEKISYRRTEILPTASRPGNVRPICDALRRRSQQVDDVKTQQKVASELGDGKHAHCAISAAWAISTQKHLTGLPSELDQTPAVGE